MPADPTPPTTGAAPDPSTLESTGQPRSRWLILPLAALGVVSAVIAGVVILYSGGSTAPAGEPGAEVRASGESLVVGSPGASTKVVVHEDLGDPRSRDFETASRDFLRIEAAQGKVLVEYRPFTPAGGNSQRTLAAWGAVLQGGTPKQALAFHDELFDRQPTAGSPAPTDSDLEAWATDAGLGKSLVRDAVDRPDPEFVVATRRAARAAGIETAPTVLLDGKPIDSDSGVELADRLQRKILAD